MIQPGQHIPDRSILTMVEQGQGEQALLRDGQWGVYYVTDSLGTVQYAGQSQAGAEGEWWVQSHAPCAYVSDQQLWKQVAGDEPFPGDEKQ